MIEKTKWGNIRIRQDLIDLVSKILKTDEAKKKGFSNISHFTDNLLRKAISDLEQRKAGYINIDKNQLKVTNDIILELKEKINAQTEIINQLTLQYDNQAKLLRLIEKYPKIVE